MPSTIFTATQTIKAHQRNRMDRLSTAMAEGAELEESGWTPEGGIRVDYQRITITIIRRSWLSGFGLNLLWMREWAGALAA